MAAQCHYCTTRHVLDGLLQWRNVAAVLWSFSSINGSPPPSPFSSTPFSYPQPTSSRADCLHPPAAEPPPHSNSPLLCSAMEVDVVCWARLASLFSPWLDARRNFLTHGRRPPKQQQANPHLGSFSEHGPHLPQPWSRPAPISSLLFTCRRQGWRRRCWGLVLSCYELRTRQHRNC
jgi:hypothetical protein